jgi:acetyl esterase
LALAASLRHCEKLNIDPARITLAGDSAGGNLAVAVALRARDEGLPVESLALIYPVVQPNFETDSYRKFATGHGLTRQTMQWFWQQYLGDDLPEAKHAKLLDCKLAGLPRTLIITAEYDVLRDEGELLAEQLHLAGVPSQLSRYDGMLHGFVHFAGHFTDAQKAIAEVASFLNAAPAN